MRISRRRIVKPAVLKRGDTVGIVAPAYSFNPNKFRKGVEKLKKLGFRVKFDRLIFKRYWSMAGSAKERAAQINEMFKDRKIKAIFCAQAGYGAIRVLPYLNKEIVRKNPKIFIGYSDITILLSYLQKVANMVVFHGPVVSSEIYEGMNRITIGMLLRAITKTEPLGIISFPGLRAFKRGKARGILTGGNISLLVRTTGTPYEIDTKDKILFLEDVAEDLEAIDSHLMHLKLAGKFKEVRGIVFGTMLDCYDYSGRKYTIRDVLKDILYDVNVPILYGFPSGHTRKGTRREANITLPLGVEAVIDADNPRLTIMESGVK